MSTSVEVVEMCDIKVKTNPIEIYKRLGLHYGNAARLEWDNKRQVKLFERFPGDGDISKRCARIYNSENNGTVIYCGPKGSYKCSVVDIDTLDETGEVHKEIASKLLPLLHKTSTLVEKTPSGGLHFYYEYNDWLMTNRVNKEYGVDWINDCIIAAPSYYNKNGDKCEYKIIRAPMNGETLTPVPHEVIEFLRDINGLHPEENPVVERPVQSDKHPIHDYNDIMLLCCCLTSDWLSDYTNWLKLLYALKSLGDNDDMMELFLDTSARAEKYSSDSCRFANERIWRRTKNVQSRSNVITLGSLHYWAKTCNKEAYFVIRKKSQEQLILDGMDSSLAMAFYNEMCGDILYSNASKEFYLYHPINDLWITKPGQIHYVYLQAMEKLINRLLADMPLSITEEEIKRNNEKKKQLQACKQRINSRAKTVINDVLPSLASSDEEVLKIFNANDDLLPLANGVWCFSEGELIEYEREHYFTRKIKINYNENADTSHIEKAMDLWFKSNKAVIKYIQYLIGYILTGYTDLQNILIIWGPIAGNGKSTLWTELVPMLLGHDETVDDCYAHPMNVKDIATKSGANQESLYNSMGKRWIYMSEPKNVKLDTEILKRLSGDNVITAQKKYHGELKFKPKGKIGFVCNDLPILDLDEGTRRRLDVIEQNVKFLDEWEKPPGGWTPDFQPKDAEFMAKLRANKEGLLKWALEGAKEFMADKKANSFREKPEEIKITKRAAISEMDKLSQWISANLEICEGSTLTFKQIREKWQMEQPEFNYKKIGFVKEFIMRLKEHKFNVDEGTAGKCRERIKNAKFYVPED